MGQVCHGVVPRRGRLPRILHSKDAAKSTQRGSGRVSVASKPLKSRALCRRFGESSPTRGDRDQGRVRRAETGIFLARYGGAMPVAHKILVALALLLPGGFFFGPALLLWLRRQRQRRDAAEPASSAAEKLLM